MKLITYVLSIVFIAGCSKNDSSQQDKIPATGQNEMLQQQNTGTTPNAVAGIVWTIPGRWKVEGDRPMRTATYSIPPANGNSEAGECAVFYFGNGQGGNPEMNIARWVAQFENPTTRARSSKDVNGMKVELLQIEGTYLAPAGPMMESQGKKNNYRLLGAIVPAPEGSVFFKFTGPRETVGAAENEFNEMINSLARHPQSM